MQTKQEIYKFCKKNIVDINCADIFGQFSWLSAKIQALIEHLWGVRTSKAKGMI